MSADERIYVEDLLNRAEEHGDVEKRVKALTPEQHAFLFAGAPGYQGGGTRPGDLFVKSEGYRKIADAGTRPQRWSTGAIDVGGGFYLKAGTLLESGYGAGLVATPQQIPGIISKLGEPLAVAELFGQAQANTSSVRYVIEGTATNASAGVAEGGTKPASTFAYSVTDEAVKKIATTLGPISDELIEDAPSIQAYLNTRLSMFVRMEEERQLLRGVGTNELVGVMDSARGVGSATLTAPEDNTFCIARVLADTAGSAYVSPDAIVMHPENWKSTRLLRDGTGGTTGQYYGGGPFGYGPYGNTAGAAGAGLFGQQLWSVPVVLSTYVGVGTALVGAFRSQAQIYRRGGVTVEASNSGYVNSVDLFTTDQIMLRAEIREALCVYRPAAFTIVSGLT